MTDLSARLESEVREQLRSQRVGYLLGAGASYLDGEGYPLAGELWERIQHAIEPTHRAAVRVKLDQGADGLEHALDLLDPGEPVDTRCLMGEHQPTTGVHVDVRPWHGLPLLDQKGRRTSASATSPLH